MQLGLLLRALPGDVGQSARGQQPRLARREGPPVTREPLPALWRRPLRQDGGRGRRRGGEGDGFHDERRGGRRGVHHGRRHRVRVRRGRRRVRRRRRDVGHHVLRRNCGRNLGGGRGRHGQPRSQHRSLAKTHCGVGRQLLVRRRPVISARVQLVRAALGEAVLVFVGSGRGGEGQERRLQRTSGAALQLLPRDLYFWGLGLQCGHQVDASFVKL